MHWANGQPSCNGCDIMQDDLFENTDRLATREEQSRFWAMLKAWIINKGGK